ncbi:MAG: hypothetical protein ACE5FD_19105, partial [Anaerolineae bacterium]
MHGGPEGLRRLMSQETLKPRNVTDTLARFGGYFKRFWPVLAITALLVIGSTWAQVTAPELIGQAVDCYIAQPAGDAFGSFPGAEAFGSASQNNCWYDSASAGLAGNERIARLGALILRIVA